MIVTKGKTYECKVCNCRLTATKGPDNCQTGDCRLSCCGKLME